MKGVPSPALAAAMKELRRSNAAQRHVPRSRKQSRAQRELEAVRDGLS